MAINSDSLRPAPRLETVKPQSPKPFPDAFDPNKANQRRVADGTQAPRDTHSEALREATDGDSTEAEQRSNLGLVLPTRRGGDKVLDRLRRSQTVGGSSHSSSGNDKKGASPQEEIAATKRPTGPNEAGTVEMVDKVEVARVATGKRHEKLMLVSSTMAREQVASHVATESARKIQKILASAIWRRNTGQLYALAARQMIRRS